MRVGFLRVSFCAAFPLSFRANWKCQNGGVFGVLRASFFSRERERKDSADSRNLYARTALGRRERCDQNAREKKTTSRRVPFLSNEFDAQKEFLCMRVCSRTKVESRKARARLAKNFVWRLFPLEKKKNILAFAPFFCPLCSFFFLFWARFCPFFGKKWREILVSQFRVLVFSSLLITTRSSFPMYG